MKREPITFDAVEVKPLPPKWAGNDVKSIPLGFMPKTANQPDRFWLGEAPNRALVLLAPDWRDEPPESWVGVAGGAWKALCGSDCDREMAELVAKGWMTAVTVYEADAIRRRVMARVIVPEHKPVQ